LLAVQGIAVPLFSLIYIYSVNPALSLHDDIESESFDEADKMQQHVQVDFNYGGVVLLLRPSILPGVWIAGENKGDFTERSSRSVES
jgi:hypothetical protein